MEKVDPHDTQHRFNEWKTRPIKDISSANAIILKQFVSDLERGINVGGDKGARSPGRILANISQLKTIMKFTEKYCKCKDITKITKNQLHQIFLDMQQGKIKKQNGELYSVSGDLVTRFKTFWHWYMKINKNNGKLIEDITEDLKAERSKTSRFVYFTKDQLEEMIKVADRDLELKTFMLLLFDSGMRAPTEALNTRVSDFTNNYKHFQIRDEVSKTFGRKIKLMFSSEAVKRYIEGNGLKDDDLLFTFKPDVMNMKLNKIGKKVLGDVQTLGKNKGSKLTMYDFRHSSCCYWLPRYKVRSQLLYRFGWRQEKQIHYYSDLIGMSDEISEEDLMIGMDKTEIEKKLNEQDIKIKTLLSHEGKVMKASKQSHEVLKKLIELQGKGKFSEKEFTDLLKMFKD